MNKDEIAGLVERWAEHGSATGKTLLEIAVSARMPDDKINQWCRALQFCSTMADAQHNALTTLSARVETLETALVAEREDNLWNAYNTGHVKDDRWSHMFMSDGEWLAVECGFDCNLADFDDAAIRAAIPVAARKALGGNNG